MIYFLCFFSECLGKGVNEEDESIYNNCLEIMEAIEKEHRVAKICIGVGISVFIVVIVLAFVYFCLIRKKHSSSKESGRLDVQPDGPMLLNNHSKTFATNL